MASTTLISSTTLKVGEATPEVTIIESDEEVTLRLTSTQIGSASSQARLVCLDDLGRVKVTVTVDGSGAEQESVGQVSGNLTCIVTCLLGECTVLLERVTGAESLGEGQGAVATADLEAGAVSLAKWDPSTMKTLRFDGVAAPGSVTLTGAAVGDRVISIFGNTTTGGASVVGGANFESTISVVDEIQQIAGGDLSGNDYVVQLAPAAS